MTDDTEQTIIASYHIEVTIHAKAGAKAPTDRDIKTTVEMDIINLVDDSFRNNTTVNARVTRTDE